MHNIQDTELLQPDTYWTLYIEKLRGFSPRANYIDRATAACRRNKCQFLRIEVSHSQSNRSPRQYSRFSRPKPLLFLPSSSSIVLTRLSVDTIPDPLLLRKSGRAGNQTQTSRCNQELWPLRPQRRSWTLYTKMKINQYLTQRPDKVWADTTAAHMAKHHAIKVQRRAQGKKYPHNLSISTTVDSERPRTQHFISDENVLVIFDWKLHRKLICTAI
jgi:hypothetical protein